MLNERNTNFESLIKNIENNKDLHQLIYKIIVEGEELTYNLDNPIIELGALYGILRNEDGIIRVHNRIYQQRIYNYMGSKLETNFEVTNYNYRDDFVKK